MELQRIVWSWEMITQRLLSAEPNLGRAIFRSSRPIAAQRYRDGRLLVVVGCWWPADKDYLGQESNRSRLSHYLGGMLSDNVTIAIARWPGGMAKAVPEDPEEQIPAPDVLSGLPDKAREEAAKCESPVQRLFFAKAYAKGLRLLCQFPLLNYRLDFAIPEKRAAAEVMGWDLRSAGPAERREREEHVEQHGWRVLLFSGSQVLASADECVDKLLRLAQTPPSERGRQSLTGSRPAERRQPYAPFRSPRPGGPIRRRP